MSPILLLTADGSATFTATVVIAGISIVVGMLLLLILIFNLFGKFVPVLERVTNSVNAKISAWWAGKKAKRAAKKAAKNGDSVDTAQPPVISTPPAPVRQAPAPVVEQGISGEVVAAIAAAVAATDGSGAVVRSIKKKNVSGRNPWSAAATADNTRPF